MQLSIIQNFKNKTRKERIKCFNQLVSIESRFADNIMCIEAAG